jgi:circadian clock protein KaiC
MLRRTRETPAGHLTVHDFMQRLALHLTSCEATTFLLGEYGDGERDNAVFTVADGIVWLSQSVERNSVVRKMQVQKMRGQEQIPGLQTMRLTGDGVRVYPRLLKPVEGSSAVRPTERRLTTGVPELDVMTGGGIPAGYSVLVAGPSGAGKTVLSNQFILSGIAAGEPGVIAVFEKRPDDYLHTTPNGEEFAQLVRAKKLEIVYVRPLDLSIDETLTTIREASLRIGAKRAVIDSLSGLELALAPTFREDFRESLYRMVGGLTGMGITVLSTVELPDAYTNLQFSPHGIAFLSDAIIMQRYVELEGELRRVIAVVKVRGSQHSKEIRKFEITATGRLVVGAKIDGYAGLLTGTPRKVDMDDAAGHPPRSS